MEKLISMKNDNSKQRLFEVMGKLNSTFKPRLNEGIININQRPLYQIAKEIRMDWGRNVNFGAKPYLDAMGALDTINDKYGYDSAKSIVLYFLSNASTWRGETAKRIKTELKQMVGLKEEVVDEYANSAERDSYQKYDAGSGANPKYTHFAVLNSNNKILTGWDYGEYDQAELRQFKKDYFFTDLANMEIDPKLVKILTAKYLQKHGIDPYDYANWTNSTTQESEVNEYDNYNYPAGADADPSAPWNQKDDPEFKGIDVIYNIKYPQSFEIIANNSASGTHSYEGFELLDMTDDPTLHQYFDRFLEGGLSRELVNSKEFNIMAEKLLNSAIDTDNIEWEYSEHDDGPDYDDDRDEYQHRREEDPSYPY